MKSASILDGIFKPISDSLLSYFPNGIYNPILDITNTIRYHFRRVQMYGHSSVQSSSTFRSRKLDKPIYIFWFKKIEQGQLLYPKFFPPIFLKTCQEQSSSSCSKWLKSWTVKSPPKVVNSKLGFCVASRSLYPNDLNFSPMS